MRQPEFPLDPDILAELEAIDATLGGQIVNPEFAELAELTVLVAAERPRLSSEQTLALDARVLEPGGAGSARRAPRRAWRIPAWTAGMSVAVAGALAAVIVVTGSGGGSNSNGPALFKPSLPGSHASAGSGSAAGGASVKSGALPRRAAKTPVFDGAPTSQAPLKGNSSSSASSPPASPALPLAPATAPSTGSIAGPSTPAPTPTARKVIQSAQLQLSASGRWIDVVAQEVFDVVGQEKGIVRNSQVTAAGGSGGYATFNLSIPSGNLSDTVTRLSALQHARVVSRTDGTQDVNGQYLSDQRRLADAQALRISLLKQLAKATTQAQIDSLQARIRTAEAQINSDQATLHRLEYSISFSQLSVTINGGPFPVPLGTPSHSSGGLTIGRAAHDAVKVLTVAAGVALIVLAALVPIGLLAALGFWVSLTVRRRRREHALDTA